VLRVHRPFSDLFISCECAKKVKVDRDENDFASFHFNAKFLIVTLEQAYKFNDFFISVTVENMKNCNYV
jgi:hypothetical protein